MTIIKIGAEWNNSHASLDGVDYTLPGWAQLPEAHRATWEQFGPFVSITTDEKGEITGMAQAQEITPPAQPDKELTPVEKQAARNAANISYLSMMTGVDIPQMEV